MTIVRDSGSSCSFCDSEELSERRFWFRCEVCGRFNVKRVTGPWIVFEALANAPRNIREQGWR
jgi:hypothetical protein